MALSCWRERLRSVLRFASNPPKYPKIRESDISADLRISVLATLAKFCPVAHAG